LRSYLIWAAGTITAYALACLTPMQVRSGDGLRAATAVALAGMALVHAAISAEGGLSSIDPISWTVDATMLLTGFFVARPTLKLRRPARGPLLFEAPVALPD
jgi:hypothetical protein